MPQFRSAADLEFRRVGSLQLPVLYQNGRPFDPRRLLIIVVNKEHEWLFRLRILQVLWASVEWSHRQRLWCIEDSRNKCLAHVEGIYGGDEEAERAIELAKEMIRDGTIPPPEEVSAALALRV